MMKSNGIAKSRILVVSLLIGLFSCANVALAGSEDIDERERVAMYERSFTKLFFYPINRILDLHDVVHVGIAGSLGLGAEIAITEKVSLGAYYTAREKGIAYHGHRRSPTWLDFPVGFGTPTALVPSADSRQRMHEVKHGYGTISVIDQRYETSSDESLRFRRFNKKPVLNTIMPSENEIDEEANTRMARIDKALNKENETAIRAEVVAGLVHPYVAIELYELLDFATGLFFIDLKSDDWEPAPGSNQLRKLGRGVSNITTGILEIPANVIEVDRNEGGMAAITYGAARGTWRFFVRSALVGPWEVATFATDSEPIIEPEFPLSTSVRDFSWRVRYK